MMNCGWCGWYTTSSPTTSPAMSCVGVDSSAVCTDSLTLAPILTFASLRTLAANRSSNESGTLRLSSTVADTSWAMTCGGSSVPSTSTVRLPTALWLATPDRPGLGDQQGGARRQPHRVVDGVGLGDAAPQVRVAVVPVGDQRQRLTLHEGVAVLRGTDRGRVLAPRHDGELAQGDRAVGTQRDPVRAEQGELAVDVGDDTGDGVQAAPFEGHDRRLRLVRRGRVGGGHAGRQQLLDLRRDRVAHVGGAVEQHLQGQGRRLGTGEDLYPTG